MLQIPINFGGNAYNSFSVNLENRSVSFRFLWNEVDGAWYMDVIAVNGKALGIKIITYSPLLSGGNRIFDNGDLVVIPTEFSNTEQIGFSNFGSAYGLFYMTESDLDAFRKEGLI